MVLSFGGQNHFRRSNFQNIISKHLMSKSICVCVCVCVCIITLWVMGFFWRGGGGKINFLYVNHAWICYNKNAEYRHALYDSYDFITTWREWSTYFLNLTLHSYKLSLTRSTEYIPVKRKLYILTIIMNYHNLQKKSCFHIF